MFTEFTTKNWRDFLPAVYKWAKSVNIAASSTPLEANLTVVPVTVDKDKKVSLVSPGFSGDQNKEILELAAKIDWKGQDGKVQVGSSFGQLALVCVSQLKVANAQIGRQFGIDLSSLVKGRNLECLQVGVPTDLSALDVFEGLCSGLYDAKLFSGPISSNSVTGFPQKLCFLTDKFDNADLDARRVLAQSAALARMLQDAPANILTPGGFAAIGDSIAKDAGQSVKILGRPEMEKEGMGSFLSVANGSPLDPKMIVVEIKGKDTSKTVSLVGKGLTFDAGGISIKPAAGMDEMKFDMSGGAAVMGAIHYFSQVKPETNVVCLIGAVENMCSGTATRPGDIVVACNGKSIEVQNTDAEGRLVLADVLSYTVKYHKPNLIIDAATLTGACLYALGHCGAALMSNDDSTADFVMKAAQDVGEPLWRLPLWPELDKEVGGTYSDLANIPKPNVKAGTIIGGVFLKEFIGETNWVHLDIAGTAWSCQATGYTGGSGSGFGMKTMIAAVNRFEK
jgi:leucyl aminopeptidase